jgi:hypothetical protein
LIGRARGCAIDMFIDAGIGSGGAAPSGKGGRGAWEASL